MADQEKDMLKQRPLQFQKTPGNHQLWTEIEVKEAIHIRPPSLQHKLDIEVDIPETWMLNTRNTKTEQLCDSGL
ncbi:hypothetical protein pdam_00025685 [Pocillopora damicornis]|uniref:Uncharacterized protein n=1 Tax=Pocillopora damicornis TaxID=46731 RepID=A0A3M6TV55_POCDA|nr:hypothetical protein pdam_00025685 [Pocillopora damicornis]